MFCGTPGCLRLARPAAIAVLLSVLALPGCITGVKRSEQVVSIFLSGQVDLDALPGAAAIVRARRATNPCIWLVCGPVFRDRLATAFGDGAFQVDLLHAAGVDAVFLGPEWLELGVARCDSLVDRGRFYFLSANLADSTDEPLGHPFMVKRLGMESVGIVGLWLDSTDVLLQCRGLRPVEQDFAARKTLPLARRRAEVVGVLAFPEGRVPDWDVDFVLGGTGAEGMIAATLPSVGDRMTRLDLSIQGGRVVDFVMVEKEPGAAVDVGVQAVLDSLGACSDSAASVAVADARVAVTPAALTDVLVDAYLKRHADGFVYDAPLAQGTLGPGVITAGELVAVLTNPGRLVLVTVQGRDIKLLTDDKAVTLRWRHGLRRRRLAMNKSYQVAMTLDFLRRHPGLAAGGYELDAEQFWAIAAEMLGSMAVLQ